VVEYTDGATAKRSFSQLQNLTIGGRQVELEMCVPGQAVPEVFTRQMALLVMFIILSFASYPLYGDIRVVYKNSKL